MNNVKKPVYGKGASLERAVSAALQDTADCPTLPADFGLRVEAIVQMQSRSKGRGFMKIAASVAVCVSLAGFAAWQIAERVGGEGAKASESVPQAATPVAALPEGLCYDNTQKTGEKSMNAIKKTAVVTATIAAAISSTAQATVQGSVFDDVKVWYKGSAGNAVGTADSSSTTKVKSLPNLAEASSAMHGGEYLWWGWRLQYSNQKVDCPYAGVTLDSTPCMVVPSYSPKTGDATVTIDGQTSSQPYWAGRRFGNLHFDNWMSDWTSGSVCSNWTCVLRFRSDQVNQVSGNPNHVIDIGSVWNETAGSATGVSLNLNTPKALADYACPRTFVTTTQKNYEDIKIKNGRWVDCAIAVSGSKLDIWLCWNDGTDANPSNKLAKISETYPTSKGLPTIAAGCRVHLASIKESYSASFTNGVYNGDMSNKAFEGAFHQIAFWDRLLSDDEIREAMAGGTGRPNLVQVGMEGNGVNEFATSAKTASVSNTGAWENLNPTLDAENTTATIAFDCPALWAGQAQWLRIPVASGNGSLAASINGTTLGTVTAVAGGVGRVFVPANVVTSGANTLVITRLQGSFAIDAVTLGGSWKFGESIGSFSDSRDKYEPWVKDSPDRYILNAACGSDKLHDRSLNSAADGTQFRFYVPSDLVGKVRGVFTTRVQNTGGSTFNFEFLANGSSLGTYGLKGGNEYEVKVPVDGIVAGWNTFTWKDISGWANIDWHKFELQQPPKGMLLVVR